MNCIFCKIAGKEINSLQLFEDDFVIAILDINPNCDGHTIIITKNHYEDYTKVPDEIMNHVMKIAEALGKSLASKLKVKGYQLAINYGDCQEIKHFHLHILPSTSKKKLREVDTVFKEITKKNLKKAY